MKNNIKVTEILKIFIIILIFFTPFSIFNSLFKNNSELNEISLEREERSDLIGDFPYLSIDTPNSRPLQITQYAKVSKSYLPLSLPTNVSFTLVEGWTSKNVTLEYYGVAHESNNISNGDFDSNSNGWNYESDNPSELVNKGWTSGDGNPPGSVFIEIHNGDLYTNEYGYFEQYITLNEPFASDYLATLSMNYKYDTKGKPAQDDISAFLEVEINGIKENKTIEFPDLIQDAWSSMALIYDPSTVGQLLPDDAIVRAGVTVNYDVTPDDAQEFYIDNIQYRVWTGINKSDLLVAYDTDNDVNYTYSNSAFGTGTSFIDVERIKNETGEVTFTIFQNSSYSEPLGVKEIALSSRCEYILNSTYNGIQGSYYTTGENITWYSEFSTFIPFGYENNWAEIKKPTDWTVISLLDGYNDERIGDCLGFSSGSESLIIPEGILGSGSWELKAISQNYINSGNIGVWNGTTFNNRSQVTIGDIFRLDITLNNTLILLNTQINSTITYPNGSTFWQGNQEPSSYDVSFGNFSVDVNMPVGEYDVLVEWTNNFSSSNRDKVGYITLQFTVWHQTNLSAVNSYIEAVVGEPVLVKVNFTDYDLNTFIPYATVTYNSTFGQSGEMTYIGAGAYILDLDTSGLGLGDYYFSFNASKNYYQNQSSLDLIHLKIIAQPLALEVPESVIIAEGNDFINCQINVTGAFSGTFIWPVNISTDWSNPYTVTDHNNGTFTLNFSTWDLPTQGIIETFSISIFVSKNYYGNASGFIAMTVHPIQTNIGVNRSIFTTDLGKHVYLKVNYTELDSEALIYGANCSITWSGLYNITSNAQGFVVCLETANLSIDTYTANIKLEKPGYETAYKSITIFINRIDIEVHTIDFEDSIEAFVGDTITIKLNLTEPDSGTYIENASIFYSWEFGLGYFEYISYGTYKLELKLPGKVKGNYKMTLIILKEGSVYKTKEFSFFIAISVRKTPNYVICYILYGLLIGISILGILSLRTYVILPKKRKKEADLLAKTQSYKDIMNIEALVISDRRSGLQLYSKSYYVIRDHQNELLSGFIQAVTLISKELVGKTILKEKVAYSDKFKSVGKVIELDFKHFNFFINEYKGLRIIFILKENASKRFKRTVAKFLSVLDSEISDKITKWGVDLKELNKFLPALVYRHFKLYYREKFRINPTFDRDRISKEEELSKLSKRLLNVIISMTRNQDEFYLEDSVKTVHEKNKDKIIEALEILIKRQVLLPSKVQGTL